MRRQSSSYRHTTQHVVVSSTPLRAPANPAWWRAKCFGSRTFETVRRVCEVVGETSSRLCSSSTRGCRVRQAARIRDVAMEGLHFAAVLEKPFSARARQMRWARPRGRRAPTNRAAAQPVLHKVTAAQWPSIQLTAARYSLRSRSHSLCTCRRSRFQRRQIPSAR